MSIKIVKSYARKLKTNKQFIRGIQSIIKYGIRDRETVDALLSQGTITFEMRTNRLQSLILCEHQDSYSIQSQRYCKYDKNSQVIIAGFDELSEVTKPKLIDYIEESLGHYRYLTKIKEGHENVAKFKKQDFEYGIPIEDARNILPMIFPCYQVITVRGDKFFDFMATIYSYNVEGGVLFNDIWQDLIGLIPTIIIPRLTDLAISKYNARKVTQSLLGKDIRDMMSRIEIITLSNNNARIGLEVDDSLKVSGAAALTCTNEMSPNEILQEQNNLLDKVTTRVMNMGHVSIGEHTTVNIYGLLSVGAYNQYIRHRHHKCTRIDFVDILESSLPTNDYGIIISKEILDFDRNNDTHPITKTLFSLSHILKLERDLRHIRVLRTINEIYSQFMVMGTAVEFLANSNITNELYIAEKRTCLNAQWEIREFTHAKLKKLKELLNDNPVLDRAMPPCLKGGCKEGKGSCGNNTEVKILFNK